MPFCTTCGTSNSIAAQACAGCGAVLTQEASPKTGDSTNPSAGYAPHNPADNYPPPGAHSAPPQMIYVSPPPAYKHPAYLAVLSLFFPGLGLLFVPNRAALGLILMGGYIFLWIAAVLLSAVYIGCCLMVCIPIYNFAAAIYSYDAGAKLTNGEFKPMIFR